MQSCLDADFYAPRRCLREPIHELWKVAETLKQAVEAHLAGYCREAEALLGSTNNLTTREWIESLWGSEKEHPEQKLYRRFREVSGSPPRLPKAERIPIRMPNPEEQAVIIAHFGRYCAFCGLPVIRAQVREKLHRVYPDSVPWGRSNKSQHSAFQALWLQFDHVLPHSRGGDNCLSNIVITCAGCNYGRSDNTLEELGLLDPRLRAPAVGSWDGLEKVLTP